MTLATTRTESYAPAHRVGSGTALGARHAEVEVTYGHRGVASLAAELDVLATTCGAGLTSRPPWFLAASAATSAARPWALVARSAVGMPLGALVLLDHTIERRAVRTTLAGTDGGHRGAVLTADTQVAHRLGEALTETLAEQHRPAPLVLGPLPCGHPVVEAFAAGLAGCRLESVDPVPVIRRAGLGLVDHLSPGTRRTLRKATNRLAADARTVTTDFTRDTATIVELLPLLERVHRERDHAQGRASSLDDDVRRRAWQLRVSALTGVRALELGRLLVDGHLAAYTLGVVDGSAYRLLEGRFVGDWARYSPGRLLEAAVVERVLESGGALTTFDWMTGVAPESLLGHNDTDPMVSVVRG